MSFSAHSNVLYVHGIIMFAAAWGGFGGGVGGVFRIIVRVPSLAVIEWRLLQNYISRTWAKWKNDFSFFSPRRHNADVP